jgi:hypothetical protein
MLSKCANPACLARFRYLHEGRIFNIEVPNGRAATGPSSVTRIEHYWLCSECSRTWKVSRRNGEAAIEPRHLELPQYCISSA